METFTSFVKNPLTGLIGGLTIGALAGHQIGLEEGKKINLK
jgi:hypothetical protein